MILKREQNWRLSANKRLLCMQLTAEIQSVSGLSPVKLERAFLYGNGEGRTWRAVMSGDRLMSEATFFRICGVASRNGWLGMMGYMKFRDAWTRPVPPDGLEPNLLLGQDFWVTYGSTVLSGALDIILAHARRCGVSAAEVGAKSRELLANYLRNERVDQEIFAKADIAAQTIPHELIEGPEPFFTVLPYVDLANFEDPDRFE